MIEHSLIYMYLNGSVAVNGNQITSITSNVIYFYGYNI